MPLLEEGLGRLHKSSGPLSWESVELALVVRWIFGIFCHALTFLGFIFYGLLIYDNEESKSFLSTRMVSS